MKCQVTDVFDNWSWMTLLWLFTLISRTLQFSRKLCMQRGMSIHICFCIHCLCAAGLHGETVHTKSKSCPPSGNSLQDKDISRCKRKIWNLVSPLMKSSSCIACLAAEEKQRFLSHSGSNKLVCWSGHTMDTCGKMSSMIYNK